MCCPNGCLHTLYRRSLWNAFSCHAVLSLTCFCYFSTCSQTIWGYLSSIELWGYYTGIGGYCSENKRKKLLLAKLNCALVYSALTCTLAPPGLKHQYQSICTKCQVLNNVHRLILHMVLVIYNHEFSIKQYFPHYTSKWPQALTDQVNKPRRPTNLSFVLK